MSRCRSSHLQLWSALLLLNSVWAYDNVFLSGQYQNSASQVTSHQERNPFFDHALISRQASPFNGPTYLPPKEVLKCLSGQQCVRKETCQGGYYYTAGSALPKNKACTSDTDICCTYRAPATAATTTQRPSVSCGHDSDCVQPGDCRNGEIAALNYMKTKSAARCYAPDVCCRLPSTTLTQDGYLVKVPNKSFPLPTNPSATVPQTYRPQPTQPITYAPSSAQPTNEYLPPQTTQGRQSQSLAPQSTQPRQPYSPQPTQYTPQSTQQRPQYAQQPGQQRPQYTAQSPAAQPRPQYTPQPTQPQPSQQYTPQSTQAQPRPQYTAQSTPAQPRPQYTPQSTQAQPRPQYTPQSTQAQPRPQYTQQPTQTRPQYTPQPTQARPQYTPQQPNGNYLPPQTYAPSRQSPAQSTQSAYSPAQQPQTTQTAYRPQAQTTQSTYRPQQPQGTQSAYSPQTQQPQRPQRPTNEYLSPAATQPTQQRPQTAQPRPQVTQPRQPAYRPQQPQAARGQPEKDYLPPITDNRIPEDIDRIPQSSNVKPLRGEDQLSPAIYPQRAEASAPIKHFAKCASALLCTAEDYCNNIGVITDQPVSLAPKDRAFRVPLTDCIIPETGAEGKCCRDSNYVDPWPVNLAGVCAARNKNTKPSGIKDIDSNFAEIPWQAMILKDSSKSLLCGGAIIGDEFVLTTASCVAGQSPSDIKIKAGEWELGSTSEPLPFQLVTAKSIDIHSDYNPSTGSNDMAIIRLQKRLEFATHIQPICITDEDPKPSEQCITTGWGKQALQIHEEGAVMHVTTTSVAARSDCGADGTGVCSATKYDACEFDVGSALACGSGSSVRLKGIYTVENGCGEGQVVRFTKPDIKWINTAFADRNRPLLKRRV